uniref:Putative n-acetyltransferase n=1 Tax=Lutzomyia longipalpis TaxID=7200 RepID=A0A1B0CCW6_LUTLO
MMQRLQNTSQDFGMVSNFQNPDICIKCHQNVVNTEHLKCKRCERNIHRLCLALGTPGDLHGDVFFEMICSQCNLPSRKEVFTRKKLPWIMVIVLVIYNLSIKSPGLGNHGYYHYRIHIANFVYKNWTHLFAPEFKRKKNWVGSVAGTLSHFNRVYFLSGSEELGSNGWWKLIKNDTPLAFFNEYEESQKQRQFFMRQAASATSTLHQAPDSDPVQQEVPMVIKKEEEEELEVPQKKIKIEEESIEDFLKPIVDSLSPLDIPDIPTSAENFFFTWDDMATNLKDEISVTKEEFSNPHVDVEKIVREEKQMLSESEEEELPAKDSKYPYTAPKSLFRVSSKRRESLTEEPNTDETTEMMSEYEEGELLRKLREAIRMNSSGNIPEDIRRFYRKLAVREEKRKLLKPLYNIDLFPKPDKSRRPGEILDRFHQLTCIAKSAEDATFSARLVGNVQQELFQSPHTERILQPYIYRDTVSMPPWVKVMCELQYTVNGGKLPSRASIDYSYVRPHHIPAVNSLLQRLFWPGIDMSESLMYPDFSVIALYRQLIVGCAFLVPDVSHNEAYISFMAVRPGWQKAGIGSFMLYHLTQTCSEKDITLHVSATNTAVFLYQKFGFKIEEIILDFYEKYLPWESKESRHAFFLRLRR